MKNFNISKFNQAIQDTTKAMNNFYIVVSQSLKKEYERKVLIETFGTDNCLEAVKVAIKMLSS